MCGIYGMVALRGAVARPEAADRLAAAVQARGPDAHRRHSAPEAVIGVHRLRVVDPRPAADQPFVRDCQVLAVNGEIYNAGDLRRQFPSWPWTSGADGEVLLPLLEGGDPGYLRGVAGMFGLAHWDARTRTLTLARDPAGEKPLFYSRHGTEVWFASRPDVLATQGLDRQAAAEFLALGVIQPPRTPFADVHAVRPGTAIVFTPLGTREVTCRDLAEGRGDGPVTPDILARALGAAVERQLVADVPLGIFLSGGLDSTLLAALARRGRARLPAFAVGFPEAAFDERPHARRVARDLGVELVEVEAGDAELLRARAASLELGEPIADPAVLPTILLAERARADVTVVLSGEGADELFGGYPTYVGHRLAAHPLARALLPLARLFPARAGQRNMPLGWLLNRFAGAARLPVAERHVAWFAGALPPDTVRHPCTVHRAPCTDPVALAMHLDFTIWLPDRLLTKLDRATMRVGLEARAPFLDPAVVRLAHAASGRHVRGLTGKHLLRAVARGRVPPYILKRRKRGMSVPVGRLLNGPLRPDVDRLLDSERLAHGELVDARKVAAMLDAHRRGAADHGRALWTLFTFEAWRERHDT